MNRVPGKLRTIPSIRRIRRNHALEHATVHLLSRKVQDTTIYARSGLRGLVVFGDVPTEEVAGAVIEALRRLRAGEYQLALHPHCGTNLVTGGALSGMAAVSALGVQQLGGKKKSIWRLLGSLPLVILASTAALIVAQPLGQMLQLYVTTDSDIGDLRITGITRRNQGRLVFHTVRTAD